jgi:hypothetical protein
MNDSRFQLNYKTKIINLRKPARRGDSRDAERRQACVCNVASDGENVSSRADTLSRIMKSEQEEKKHQLRLSKSKKVRFRKNSLWDRKQKNGPVIHIDPKDYQKSG